MKKFLALLVAASLLVFVGGAMAAESPSSGGHIIPIEPEQPTPGGEETPAPSTGSEEAKTVEAAVSTTTETKTTTITTTTTTTVTTTTYATAAAKAVAEVKVVKTVTKTEIKETTTVTVTKNEVKTTDTALQNMLTSAATTGGNANEVNLDAFTSALVAATTTGEASATNDTSNADATAAMAASLLKGAEASAAGSSTGNTENATLASLKREGESLAATIIRVIAETLAKVEEKTNTAAEQLAAAITGTEAPVQVKTAANIQNATTTKTITNADGTTSEVTDDNAMSTDDAMAALHQQAAQNLADATPAERAEAERVQQALATQVPVQSIPPMEVPEPGIYPQNTTHKKDMYKKPLFWNVIKNDTRSRGRSFTFNAKAIAKDGDAVFLNSAGQEITAVPGEDEWTKDTDGSDLLIVPGFVTTMIYMEPGVTYTPIITTAAEAVSEIDGIDTATEEAEVEVVEEKVVTASVPVYEASDGSYSTSFDASLETFFAEQGYNTMVGSFVVAGEAGVWSANTSTDNAALSYLKQAVVRTLPKLDIKGDNAGDTGNYVMKVRFDIPRNDDVQKIEGTNLLRFYPKGFETSGDALVANLGEAVYLQTNGRAELTDAMIEQIAAGNLGTQLSDTVMGYDGYVVMALDKLGANDEPYTPLFTVQMTAIAKEEPLSPDKTASPDLGTFSVTANPRVISVKLGETATSTLTATNAVSTVRYASSASWVTISGTTATIAPTDEALIASSPNTVTITATDTGRTENATATVTLNINVTSEDQGPTGGSLGSSGGGCSAGWSVLALALLGGLIARKK